MLEKAAHGKMQMLNIKVFKAFSKFDRFFLPLTEISKNNTFFLFLK
jgi:hypothetical protein